MYVQILRLQRIMHCDLTDTPSRHFALKFLNEALHSECIEPVRRAEIINSYEPVLNAELKLTILEAVGAVTNLQSEHIIIEDGGEGGGSD